MKTATPANTPTIIATVFPTSSSLDESDYKWIHSKATEALRLNTNIFS